MIKFLTSIPTWLLLLLSAVSVIAGDYFAKFWSTNQKPAFFILSIIGYVLSGVFFIPILLREGLVWASLIWVILSAAGFIFIGLVLFHETLTTIQTVGLILGVLAIILLNL